LSLTISIQNESFYDSDHILAQILRGTGFKGERNNKYHPVSRLIKDSSEDIYPKKINFKTSQYSVSGWADTRWRYRKNITIDASKVSADLNNFPLLITLFDTDLQNDAQASGNDIMFTDATGAILYHEIETYNRVYNSTHAHLAAWVKTNLSGTQDTILSMYYGNPTIVKQENQEEVWDSYYRGIWHLSENPSDSAPQMKDSTSNNNDGTAQGGMDTENQIDARIDGGLKFEPNNNINCGIDSSLDLVQEFSVEFWVNIRNETGASSWPPIISRGNGQLDKGWMLFQNEQSSKIDFVYRDTSEVSNWILDTGTALQLETWYHIVVTYSVSQGVAKLFIDGSQFDTDNTVSEIQSSPLGLFIAEGDFNGSLDEIRISDIARSSDWISTEYNNQYDPSSFYTLGNKQYRPIFESWPFPSMRYRKNVTINSGKVSSDLTNFPVLINLFDTDLHDKQEVQVDGGDILFADKDGIQLDHEIELFDKNFNSSYSHLVAWVRIPSLSSSSDTIISMYFGNPTIENQGNPSGVWDENYISIWHLNEDGSGTRYDSTSNNNDGTPFNYEGDEAVPGKIGGSDKLDGINDYIEINKNGSIKGLSKVTFEGWINIDNLDGSSQNIYVETIQNSGDSRFVVHVTTSNELRFAGRAPDSDSVTLWGFINDFEQPLTTDSWFHVVAIFDSVNDIHHLYLNGVEYNTSLSEPALDSADPLKNPSLGGLEGADLFNGTIDEFRVSATSRSLDWITTEYENQNNPNSFYSISSLETPSPIGNWTYPWLAHRKDLIINSNKVHGSLNNFPLLVQFYDADLASSSAVQEDGDDIAFVDNQGNRLDHEIELFNKYYNSSHSELIAWVRLPNISNLTETKISMYYGNLMTGPQENPAGVWDTNFKGVWHLSDDPSQAGPQIKDSTSNVNDGTTYGSMTSDDQVSGKIGGSLDFDGINDYINFTDDTSLNMGSGDFSFELWFEVSTVTDPAPLGGKGLVDSGGKRYAISIGPNAECSPGQIKGEIDDDTSKEYAKSSARYDDSLWHHVAMVRDGTNLKLYIDGTEIAVEPIGAYGNIDINKPFLLGRIDPLIEHFGGKFDEVRISNVAYSSDWIKTSWNNQNNSKSFYSVREVEIAPYFDDWAYPWLQYRKSVLINSSQISGRLSDFPLLIDIFDTDLFDTNKVQIDGSDIAFGDATGTRLTHEIELFDQAGNGTHAHLIAWVRIPNLYINRPNDIFMYYGNKAVYNQKNATGVWDSNYVGVWHMTQDPSGVAPQIKDSTFPYTNGTSFGSMTSIDLITGKIGNALDFDGIDDYIDLGTPSEVNITDALTIETWFRADDTGNTYLISKNGPGPDKRSWDLSFDPYNTTHGFIIFRYDTDGVLPHYGEVDNVYYEKNKWYHVVGVFNPSKYLRLYLNGQLIYDNTTAAASQYDAGNPLRFGTRGDNPPPAGSFYDGIIDEVRISNIARSSDWIRTEYNNQYDTLKFYSLGVEEETLRWADSSFSMKMDIGINDSKISGTLIDFPLLVDITDANLKTGKLQPDADDILFIDINGIKLDHEVEFFSQDSNEGHIIAWVRLPKLSNSQYNLISMYFNNPDLPSQVNPNRVWDSNFKGIWHLNNDPADPAPQIKDSTSNANDGTTYNGMTSSNLISGMIDGSLNFSDTLDNYVNFGDQASLNMGSGDLSLSLWINYPNYDHNGPLAGKGAYSGGGKRYYIAIEGNRFKGEIDDDDSGGGHGKQVINTSLITENKWYHVELVRDGNYLRLYIDGVESPGSPADITGWGSLDMALPFYMNTLSSDPVGTLSDWSENIMDEVRVSNIARSSNWIKTSYDNQKDPSSFYSIGSVFYYDLNPPEINKFGINDPGTGTGIFWADVSDEGSNVVTVDIDINGTVSSMNYNGSHWVYQQSVVFGVLYEYQIANTSDSKGNYVLNPSSVKQNSFTNDIIPPTVDEWEYFDNIGVYGTFEANVSDSWGLIDTVIVNVTELNSVPRNDLWSIMVINGSSYTNDTISMPKGSTFWYVIWVNDTTGNSYTTTPIPDVIPDINHAPEAQNIALSRDNSLVLLPIYSNSTLYLHYDFYDADNDSEGGTEIRWYKSGVVQSAYNDLKQISNTTALVKGDLWNATVRPKDGQDFGTLEATVTITIQNTPPVIESVVIPPSISTDNLTLTNVTTDEDTDPILNYEIKWYRNSTYMPAFDNLNTITSNNTKKAESWSCEIRANDGTNYSQWVSSNTIIIGNTPPTTSNLILSPLNPNTSSILTASWNFDDADNDSQFNYYIEWYRWDTHRPTYNNLINLPSAATLKNQEWYFKLIVNDGESNSTAYSSPRVTIQNTPPTASGLTITLDPFTYTSLTASWNFNDGDGDSQPSDSWITRWYKNNVLQSDYNNLTTIPDSATSKGEVWNYTLKVYDGTNYSIQYNSSISIIQNSIPTASGLTITLAPTTTENITASWNYADDDNDPQNTSWIIYWYKDNILQALYTNKTIILSSDTLKGELWNFTLKVFDGEAYSIQYNSSTTLVVNTPPTVITPSFNKTSSVTEADTLNITYSYDDPDNDAEITSKRVVYWYQNSLYRPGKDNQTILYDFETATNDYWQYQIRVYDGSEWSQNFTSNLVVIGNAPNNIPEAQNVTLTANENTTIDSLVLNYDYYDQDGHLQSNREIFWYKNGLIQVGLNDSTVIDSSLTTKVEVWNCTIRVYDGLNWSIQYNSSEILILNALPTVTEISITMNPTTDQDLVAGWTYYDPDNDSENSGWIIRWYKNGQLQKLLNDSKVVIFSNTTKGEFWNYTLHIFDGTNYSIQYNSSLTVIVNSPPSLTNPSFNKTFPTSDHSIEITYTYKDIDADLEDINNRIVYWYKGPNYQPIKTNHSVLSWQETQEGDIWYYIIRVFDGTDYSTNYTSVAISIGASTNDPPIAENLTLTLNPTTFDNLMAFYDYYDNQSHPEAGSLIRWYKNDELQSHLNDTKLVPSSETKKDEVWYFTIRPMDGRDYGSLAISSTILILNTEPTVLDHSLTSSPSTVDDLTATWLYNDVDNDPEESSWIIRWYKNNVLQSDYNNLTTILDSATSKGEIWNYTLKVYDGTNYSIQYNSSSTIIENTIPYISDYYYEFDPNNNLIDPDLRTSLTDVIFFVEDENLSITYIFEDADQPIDADLSLIQWYYQIDSGSWLEVEKYQNQTVIPFSETSPGDHWKCNITVYDGTDVGLTTIFPEIVIESRPIIQNCIVTPLINNSEGGYYDEGLYDIQIITTNLIPITIVECSINDSLDQIYYARQSPENESIWILEYQLPLNAFRNNYLHKLLFLYVTSSSLVTYNDKQFKIYNIMQVNFTVEDQNPPRVVSEPHYELNDEFNPTTITFYANIVDYGSEIANVKLFYHLREVSDQGGNGASLAQDWRIVEMLHVGESGGSARYSITVPFDHNKTSREIIYYIQTTDANGNTGKVYDITNDPDRIKETRFNFSPPGIDPTIVMIIIAITIIAAIFGSIIYVKFIRKPEIVGLDKELVLETLSEISDTEMMDSLDSHTIGTVISFFDQRHGPIPIIVVPEILRDNFRKLVELSDRSFSGTGFCDNFDVEITSSYDFVLDQGVRTKVMSFGFALERSEARGGQENLTANILIHHELFPLVNQFLYDIQHKVHSIHKFMNNKSSEKETIRRKVFNLRKYISNIILAYEKIYGDAELFSEENVQS